MAVTTFGSGTQSTTVTTEHFLSSPNEAGVFQLVLDLVNLASGDFLEIRCYQMTLTGGTARVADIQTVQGAQPTDGLIWRSEPMVNDLAETNGLRFSIKQTLGSTRNIPWKVSKVA